MVKKRPIQKATKPSLSEDISEAFLPTLQSQQPTSAASLLQLQRQIGNRAVCRMLGHQAPPSSIQRMPKRVAIKGITHLVRLNGKSVFKGEETHEVEDGNIIQIETSDRIRSRRGPNQETYREEDRTGEKIYRWFKVVEVNGVTVDDDDIYVRDDTFEDVAPAVDVPDTITGSQISKEIPARTATSDAVNQALIEYLKTGDDVEKALQLLYPLTVKDNMEKAAKNKKDQAEVAAGDLLAFFATLQEFAKQLKPLGDGAREPALFFVNQLKTATQNFEKGMPPNNFVSLVKTIHKKSLELIGTKTELGDSPFGIGVLPADPFVGEHMSAIMERFDILSRKTSASTRREGAIHEVDLAMMERVKGMADVKASIDEGGKVIIEPGQAERAFAIGFQGAIDFTGDLSNQGGERLYGTLFPKGWLDTFSQDIRIGEKKDKSYREPGREEYGNQAFEDKGVTITIEDGKAFLIRAEESTGKEGQITVHMDRNELLFGGVPMLQFIRNAVLGVVEFDMKGIILHMRMFK